MTETARGGQTRSTARVLLTGGMWNNLSSLVPIAINIVLTPFIIHGFGVSRWGLFVLVSSIGTFLGPLNGGLGGTVGRFFAVYAGRDDRVKTTETLVTMILVLSALGAMTTVLCWYVAPLVIDLFGVRGGLRGEGIFLLRTLGILFTISFIHNLFGAVVNARQRWALTNILGTATYGVWTVGLILCVDLRLGLRGVAVVFLAQQFLATVVIVPTSLQYLTRRGLRLLSWTEFKAIMKYAASIQVMSMIALVNNQVDSLLIGGLFSLSKLAYYNAGSNFALQLRNVTLNLLGPAGNHLAQVFGREGEAGAAREFRKLQRLWVIGTTGWCSAGLGAAYFGVIAWIGPGFRLGGEVAVIAIAGSSANLWTGVLTQYLSAVGRPALEVRYATLAMIINIVLTVPLAFFGPLGVTAATAIGMIIASLYLVRIVRHGYRSDLPHFLREVPAFPALVTFVVTVALEIVIRPYSPGGVVGLLYCGLPAAVGLLVFGVMVLGREAGVLLLIARHGRAGFRPLLHALLRDNEVSRVPA